MREGQKVYQYWEHAQNVKIARVDDCDDDRKDRDDLAAARGLVHGCLASLVLWALILAAMWLATR